MTARPRVFAELGLVVTAAFVGCTAVGRGEDRCRVYRPQEAKRGPSMAGQAWCW